jgi:hypothetical protein
MITGVSLYHCQNLWSFVLDLDCECSCSTAVIAAVIISLIGVAVGTSTGLIGGAAIAKRNR